MKLSDKEATHLQNTIDARAEVDQSFVAHAFTDSQGNVILDGLDLRNAEALKLIRSYRAVTELRENV